MLQGYTVKGKKYLKVSLPTSHDTVLINVLTLMHYKGQSLHKTVVVACVACSSRLFVLFVTNE